MPTGHNGPRTAPGKEFYKKRAAAEECFCGGAVLYSVEIYAFWTGTFVFSAMAAIHSFTSESGGKVMSARA